MAHSGTLDSSQTAAPMHADYRHRSARVRNTHGKPRAHALDLSLITLPPLIAVEVSEPSLTNNFAD